MLYCSVCTILLWSSLSKSVYESCAWECMACHCWIVICSRCASVVLACTSLSTLCFSWSQKCSIEFKSGEQANHPMIVIPFCARWSTTAHAVGGVLALSWRIKFSLTCWAKGCTQGLGILVMYMYHWAFKLPLIHATICFQPHVIGEYISEPAYMNELYVS